jgi:hypothetical protein
VPGIPTSPVSLPFLAVTLAPRVPTVQEMPGLLALSFSPGRILMRLWNRKLKLKILDPDFLSEKPKQVDTAVDRENVLRFP